MELDVIRCMDCLEGLRELPDNCVDLVVTDPPYLCETSSHTSLGKRHFLEEITPISSGFDIPTVCKELLRVLKAPNIYVWCNPAQMRDYVDFFGDAGCSLDVLTWHKTNPTPLCANKYLPDTEYCLFFRGKGVKVSGTYASLHKFWVQQQNRADKAKYGHPTVKPMDIIATLVENSSSPDGVVLDPFMGSGTTAAACVKTGRHYLGFEIDETYHKTANDRIAQMSTAQRFF